MQIGAILAAVVLSVALPWAAFTAITTPYTSIPGGVATARMLLVLDIPVAALNCILPYQWRSNVPVHFMNAYSSGCCFCTIEMMRTSYMRVGIPAYAILFTGLIGGFMFRREEDH
ncbi:MAG TPA: hypothetical protein VMU84_05550 [Thermoanaerobaculia bacterium]|nr:hypothetical protein [Thermoanaerobaculia bacterium]